jgi:type II secretory ATPase GspE/PulE/Tfp pilus assembly ATPase PilB-like protein
MAATDRIIPLDPAQEIARARAVAERYYHEFVDLKVTRIDHDLFHSIPVDLMFRYNFVPIQAHNGSLEIALADPRNLSLIDELAVLLGKKLRVKVATLSQISDLLKKTEQSQRVLEEVTEGFTLDVVGEEENPEETLSIDKLSNADSDIAPVIKLVDTTIFNALERRASDIHIETRDQEVAIKYRIDGVLHYAMPPISKDWHSTIISRIKVMSELDIAERRVPQDGRFRVRYKSRLIDFRVSIMPTIHGEDAVLRVLDKESMSEKFAKLVARRGRIRRQRSAQVPALHQRAVRHGAGDRTYRFGQDHDALRRRERDQKRRRQDHHHRRSRRIPDQGHHADSGKREEGPDVRARAALDFAPRSGQDHGGRNSRPGNRADRHQRRAHRPPGVHHGSRQQRTGRAGTIFEHGRRAVQFRFGLNCILAQRLVRVICPHCKKAVQYGDDYFVESGLNPENWRHVELYEGVGCFECGGTGFRGRSAIHELLDLSEQIRELILNKRPASEIRRAAREEGMTFLRESAIEKARAGVTTLKEINKVTFIEG